MKTQKRKVNQITWDLVLDEMKYHSTLMTADMMFGSQVSQIFGMEEHREYFRERLIDRVERLRDHLFKRYPQSVKIQAKVEKTHTRYQRMKSNLASDHNPKGTHYCQKYNTGESIDFCNQQCFECVADLGEYKRLKNILNNG